MSFHYYLTDVFTDRPFGGNQLAVFPDAGDIPEQLLLPIAREFNFSEVTFVYPAADARNTRRVRIFTPGGEIPFAGHPTVGTAFVLFASGELRADCREVTIVLEEGVGAVPVVVRFPESGGLTPSFGQLSVARLPEVVPPSPDIATLAEALSLDAGDFLGGEYGPEAVSCGIPFLMVPLRSRDAVRRARVRTDVWERTLKGTPGSEMMVFALDPERPGTDLRARVFVPGLNITEDPATGSASACLGGYLAKRTPRDGTLRWVSEQGVEMGRPSVIEIEADKRDGRITAVRVGGSSVMVGEGTLKL